MSGAIDEMEGRGATNGMEPRAMPSALHLQRRRYRGLEGGVLAGMLFAGVAAASDPAMTNGLTAEPAGQATNRWDQWHDSLYTFVQSKVEIVDSWFVAEGTESRPVPQPRFRMGMFGTVESGAGTNGSFSVLPLVDGDADIDMPNTERRLRLLVTTTDPTMLPGSQEDSDMSLRVGVMRDWWESWNGTLGVKARIPPDIYAKLTWVRIYAVGPVGLYPHQKVYWEASEGVGEVSSIMADYWRGRFDFRYSGSLKWSEELQDREAEDPDGWLWEQSLGCLYVNRLLNEKDYGRRVRGSDIAHGGGVRLYVSGGLDSVELYRLSVFTKRRIFSDWLFQYIVPEVEWREEDDWEVNYKLTFGVEALFWGPARP